MSGQFDPAKLVSRVLVLTTKGRLLVLRTENMERAGVIFDEDADATSRKAALQQAQQLLEWSRPTVALETVQALSEKELILKKSEDQEVCYGDTGFWKN